MKPDFLVKTRRQAIARARRKFSLKDYDGALEEWDELLRRNDEDPLAWLGRFDCLMKLDRKAEMLEIGDKVCDLFPDSEAAHNNYACLLLEKREFEKACSHFDRALALAPGKPMYFFNAGLAYRGASKLNQAAVCFEHVLVHEPEHERAMEFLSQIYMQFGMAEKAMALSMRLRMLRPGYTLPLQRRLHIMVNNPDITENELNLELSLLRSALTNQPHRSDLASGGLLRIGWMLCPYSVGFLRYVMPVLQKLARSNNALLIAYCNQSTMELDDIEPFFDAVHRTPLATTDALASLFQENPVDVLLDTAGQVPNNLIQHFAKRLAPLQISWPFFHTQLEMVLMDHALVDGLLLPDNLAPGAALQPGDKTLSINLHDRLVSLGDGQFFYDPGEMNTLASSELPALGNGYVTFGVVSDPIQINPHSVNMWARILKNVPNSRLAFHHSNFPALIAEEHLIQRCEAAGVESSRISFVTAPTAFERRCEPYADIDILLSPWPVTDDMALIDAGISGCPVVAMVQGTRGASRAGSLLRAAGIEDFVVEDQSAYVNKASSLAKDVEQLSSYRHTLPDAVRNSALCDCDGVASRWYQVIHRLADHR